MGKEKRRFIVLSGFNINDNNRGTAALGYGAISFLKVNNKLKDQNILKIRPYKNFFKLSNHKIVEENYIISGNKIKIIILPVFYITYILFKKLGIILPFCRLRSYWKRVDFVAAINGGDGFSDIYGTKTFLARLPESIQAMHTHKTLILLPQTIGPFKEKKNLLIAQKIMRYATSVYVRDNRFEENLKKMNIDYALTHDLSYFMQPEPFDIDIQENAIGLNISGLAYSNNFRALSGKFENYPYLCEQIISLFQKLKKPIYLISHSYNYEKAEKNNDDIEASRNFYQTLKNKSGVILVDRNLTSPQTKYLISKMSFFIGTRMHANFAAIFTKVPVFGLAYSYKFQGSFEKYGLFNQTAMINNIDRYTADQIIKQIESTYNRLVTIKHCYQ